MILFHPIYDLNLDFALIKFYFLYIFLRKFFLVILELINQVKPLVFQVLFDFDLENDFCKLFPKLGFWPVLQG